MAKKSKRTMAGEETRLTKKVADKLTGLENPEGNEAFRQLHKRLKRIQRKRRRLALRKQNAMGKKKAAAAPKAAAPAA